MLTESPIRIFVGLDRSQKLACQVLERSIRKRTSRPVELTPMMDLPLPEPSNPQHRARTGFSFARFAIPELAGHTGRALYLDADMLVLSDIGDLWDMPFNGAKVICQEELPAGMAASSPEPGRPRRKQCSVMLLDCETLKWDSKAIIAGLGTQYTYEQLMQDLCILAEADVSYALPVRWNSLEHLDAETCLIHYTDMPTQPWVCATNPNGWIWINELREAIAEGVLTRNDVVREIEFGYFRPSLLTEIDMAGRTPTEEIRRLQAIDANAGYRPHNKLMQTLDARTSPWLVRAAHSLGRRFTFRA